MAIFQMETTLAVLGDGYRYATEMVRGLGSRLQRGAGAFRSVNGTTHPASIARSMILLEHFSLAGGRFSTSRTSWTTQIDARKLLGRRAVDDPIGTLVIGWQQVFDFEKVLGWTN